MYYNYKQDLKDRRWQRKRLEIINRDEWMCKLCHSQENAIPLNVHHLKYNGRPWEADDDDLITLCENCHAEIHKKGLEAVVTRRFKIIILQMIFTRKPWLVHEYNSVMYFNGRKDMMLPIKWNI